MVLLHTIYSVDRQRLLVDPQIQPFGESDIALVIRAAQVRQQAAALTDQFQQAAARRLVVFMGAKVLGELVNARGEDRDLHLRRAGVRIVTAIGPN